MQHPDFLIIGAGIFGITAALELRRRGHTVAVLDPGPVPHPLAASTDISKVVRMEYGSDRLYFDMAEAAIEGWHAWNHLFGEEIYHETGFLLLCREPMESDSQAFERDSYSLLLEKHYAPQCLDAATIAARFPALAAGRYVDGFYNPRAGWAESGRTVALLCAQARQSGVSVEEGQTADHLVFDGNRVTGVATREGRTYCAGHVVLCAGAWSPLLVPELRPVMRATGHPVFHLKPARPELFSFPALPVFAADISRTGWYGFPFHPKEGVVKIANHGPGLNLHPEQDERVVTEADTAHLRLFLGETFPALADAPIVFTRRCLYCDTPDGHFWIDRHPAFEGLTVGTGGSGHALKMAPVLGPLITAAAGGDDHPWLRRFRWRSFSADSPYEEAARFTGGATSTQI